MKKLILSPLFLGLVLTGCNRTETDSKKLSSNDQSDANKPAQSDPAVTAPKDAAKPSEVATAATPATVLAKDTSADPTKSAPDSTMMAADSTPAASKDPAAIAPVATPAAGAPVSMTPESSQVAAMSPADMAEGGTKTAIADRITQWNLTSDQIKTEFDSSGRVARSKTLGAGEPTGLMDELLVTLVTGKLKDDADTSSLKIAVAADKGVVTLTGKAHSLDQIGKAVALALDTNGANQAISTITLDPAL